MCAVKAESNALVNPSLVGRGSASLVQAQALNLEHL